MRGAFAALAVIGCSFRPGTLTGDGGDDGPHDVRVDSPWLVTRRLVLDNSASKADFLDFPVLVALDATKIDYSLVGDPAKDLRFEDPATQAPIAYEIENWNPAGESIVWIRVPYVAMSTTTSVLMHYGPLASGAPSAVFTSSAWELVHHFTPPLDDVASGKYAGTAIGATEIQGHIGSAIAFSGAGDQRVTFANAGELFNGWDSFNLMFWLYVNYANANGFSGEPAVMEKSGSLANGRIFKSGPEIKFQIDFHFTGMNNDAFLNTVVPPRTWTLISYVYDKPTATLQIFNNGVGGSTFTMTGVTQQNLVTDVQAFYLGAATGSFAGRIDELRVERRSRAPDFMRAQYLIMTRQFVTFTDP